MTEVDAEAQLPATLNLGCGDDYQHGAHNVDISPAVGPDEVVNLDDFPWPFPSEQFVHIDARHVLEHLSDPMQALHEICRILRPDGTLTITYPIGHTRFEDPTHSQFWGYHTAAALAGDRQHAHEIDVPLELLDREVEWAISQSEPVSRLYTRYRLAVSGPGPWLEQVPGLHGEVYARYRYNP